MKGVTGTIAGGVAGCILCFALGLEAQSTEAAATALFDQGRKLMAQHRYAEACPKLSESQRLAPSGGTLLNLAECYERNGQTASAWLAWTNAAARANAAGKADAEARALARAAALEPGLSRLAISVSRESDVPGLEVTRDGVEVGRAELGVALPVDPGVHVIEAAATNRKRVKLEVDVAPKQSDAHVAVSLGPAEEAVSAPAVPPAAETTPPLSGGAPGVEVPAHTGSTQRTVGLVLGVAGVAGVAAGSVFGLIAKSKNDEALQPENCRTRTFCTQPGLALTSEAKDAALVSDIAFAAGGAALVGGIALWLTAPSRPPSNAAMRVRFVPAAALNYGGFSLEGAW